MITLKNLRNEQPDPKNIWQVRVDRASVLGNPFPMALKSDRDAICDKYADMFDSLIVKRQPMADIDVTWMQEATSELLRLQRIYGHEGKLELFCWCAPLRCHGTTIKNYILDQVGDPNPDQFHSEE